MPKFKSKKHGIVFERCDICGEYSCYGDRKNYYCGNCVDIEIDSHGIKFILKKKK